MEEDIFDAIYEEEETTPTAPEDGADGTTKGPENKDDNPTPDPEPKEGGEAETDEHGNPEGTEYDEDGNPTNLDEEGNIITGEEDEKDENGNPKGTEYDEDGNPTNLDENGNLKDDPNGDSPSVMTQFFDKQFGVKDGKIPFADGSEMALDEMTPEQQLEALEFYTKHMVNEASGKVSDQERAILSEIRKSGKSFDDIIAEEVNNRLVKNQVNSELGEAVDYTQMPDDEVYKMFIKQNKPDLSEEGLNEIVEKGKDHPAYDATVAHYRQHLVQTQEQERSQKEAEKKEAVEKELNEDRETIIDAVRNLDNVAEWPLNDDVKNEVLEDLVEVDSEGNSNFMKEVFGDPTKMFEAAWYMKYGEAYFQELNKHWKSENEKLQAELDKVKKGGKPTKSMAKPGTKPAAGKSANKTGTRKKGDTAKTRAEPKNIDDIYEDN